jgi:KDO2-lipid IV(A) lauroyltransferase
MKTFGYYVLGTLLRGMFYLTDHIPNKIIFSFSKQVSSVFIRISHRYRRRIARNLQIAFGKTADKQKLTKIAHSLAENLGLNFAETLISSTAKKKSLLDSIQIHGIEHLEKALSYNKGVLACSAHLGNFTLIGLKMAAAGYPFHMLVKDPRYPAVAEAFHVLQKGQGGKFIYVEPWDRALRQILSRLRKNEIVCILADEKKSKTGVIVDFFGHPAPTAPGPAVLALRTGAPLVPIFIARNNDGLQHIYIEPQLELNLNGDRSSDIPAVVSAYTKVIENYIRMYPDQWFWINNRWKKQIRDQALRNA